METLHIKPQNLQSHEIQFMNSLFSRTLKTKTFASIPFSISTLKPFCTLSSPSPSPTSRKTVSRNTGRVGAKVAEAAQLKENWLESLTYPLPDKSQLPNFYLGDSTQKDATASWVIGIDPDISGALALLKMDESGCSARVFDSPHLKVMVGKKVRKRLDAKSIVQLLHNFGVPLGTTAYIEQSIPYPQDGKLGWWNGGFGYGLWIGTLVASGFSVVPVPSITWKNEFDLSGGGSTKDDSRRVASTLFPSLSSSLQRKRDHGRAEALLIAAYGKSMKEKSVSPCVSEELP